MIGYFDVLNENGVKTGELCTRQDAHKLGIWHRAVIVAIVNDDNQVLVQQRAKDKEKFPNLWDISMAGHVSSGDDATSTASKELNEEIGVTMGFNSQVKDFRFITSFRRSDTIGTFIENQYYDLFIIRKNLYLNKDLSMQLEEVQDIQWKSIPQILKMRKECLFHPRTEWIDEVIKFINKF